MATKTANLYARIEPKVKKEAEHILNDLGISASNAINIFYKQIILRKGIPFDVTIPNLDIPDINELSEEELKRELQKGLDDIKKGNVKSAREVFANLKKSKSHEI